MRKDQTQLPSVASRLARGPLPLALCLVLLSFGGLSAAPAPDDVVLRAMREELVRSMQQLQLQSLDKPYFIAYRVQEKNTAAVVASFGAVVASTSVQIRTLTVEVRVGSPKLDNTNFLSMSFLTQGGLAGGFGGMVQLPLSDNYKELRRQLWLATDSAYKAALENLSRKRAALQNKTSTEEVPDFRQQQPASILENAAPPTVAVSQMETLARRLSALYTGSPAIYADSAQVAADVTHTLYVNSEGTTFTRTTPAASVILLAATQAADGAPLRDSVAAYGRALGDLPPLEELQSRATAMGSRLEKLRDISPVDHFNGPVLFEGEAAAELFSQVIAPAVLAVRSPVSDVPQFEAFSAQMQSPFQDRLGGRVLPDFLSVTDDPTLARYEGQPLLGTTRVDDDGTPTRRTVLVENGRLKTLLTTRNPVSGITQSTGNRRGMTAAPFNLIVTVQPGQGLSEPDLRKKFLAIVKQREFPFGIVVEQLANPLAGNLEDMLSSFMGSFMSGQGGVPEQVALVAYKVFPDGHQELARDVTLEGLNPSSFKDIVAASTNHVVYSTPFLSIKNSVFSLFGGGGLADASVPLASFVVPSLLFDDVTLKKPGKENPKLPLSPRPLEP